MASEEHMHRGQDGRGTKKRHRPDERPAIPAGGPPWKAARLNDRVDSPFASRVSPPPLSRSLPPSPDRVNATRERPASPTLPTSSAEPNASQLSAPTSSQLSTKSSELERSFEIAYEAGEYERCKDVFYELSREMVSLDAENKKLKSATTEHNDNAAAQSTDSNLHRSNSSTSNDADKLSSISEKTEMAIAAAEIGGRIKEALELIAGAVAVFKDECESEKPVAEKLKLCKEIMNRKVEQFGKITVRFHALKYAYEDLEKDNKNLKVDKKEVEAKIGRIEKTNEWLIRDLEIIRSDINKCCDAQDSIPSVAKLKEVSERLAKVSENYRVQQVGEEVMVEAKKHQEQRSRGPLPGDPLGMR